MGANQKQFVPTVARCFLRDKELDLIVMKSKTLVNAGVKFDTQNKEITGGEFSKLLYDYSYGRKGTVDLDEPRWEPSLIALSFGQKIKTELSNVYVFEETVILDATGKGKVVNTPISGTKAYVQTPENLFSTVAFTTDEFDMGLPYANKSVKVTYQYNTTVETIKIDGESYPKSYELVMEVKVFGNKGHEETVQYIFPNFKLNGSVDIPMSSENPVSLKVSGKILDEDDVYGYMKTIPVTSTVNYVGIACDVDSLSLDATNSSYTLKVYGIRGGIYENVLLNNSDISFTSSTVATATVGANTGIIARVASGDTDVTATYNGFTDKVTVTCT